MADGYRADAAFGLRRFSGIIDDEGIKNWQIADQGFRPAGTRQCHRFAGQPFQRSVRTHVDDRVDALLPQPEIKRDISVSGRARQVVIFGVAVSHGTAFRLERNNDLATTDRVETDSAVAAARIVLWHPPGVRKLVPQ